MASKEKSNSKKNTKREEKVDKKVKQKEIKIENSKEVEKEKAKVEKKKIANENKKDNNSNTKKKIATSNKTNNKSTNKDTKSNVKKSSEDLENKIDKALAELEREENEIKEVEEKKAEKSEVKVKAKVKEKDKVKSKDSKKATEKIKKEKTDKEKKNKEKFEKKDKKQSNKENIKNKKKDSKNKENKEQKVEKKKEEATKKDKEPQRKLKIKRNLYIALFVFIMAILMVFFSSIFALVNMNHSNIANGVKIKNIDVSGLTIEEAKDKINKAIEVELIQDLILKYEDKYTTNLESTDIEFSYDIDKAIEEAKRYGREGNIVQNNYALLFAGFFGKNIEIEYIYNEEFLTSFVDDLESKLPGVVTPVTYYIEEDNLIINKGIDGISIDKENLKDDIINNIYERNADNIVANLENQELEIEVFSKKADPIDMDKIYGEVYTEPKDAYYELEPFNIYPEVNGVDLEIGLKEAKKQIKEESKDEYIFKLKITPAEKTIKSFGVEAFPNLVSSFSTKYKTYEVNRSKNLEIAAQKINGLVLLPGEEFSFNKVVGKRTVEEGYKDAKIYVDGGVQDGLAGGICQISSTLYNAVLLANLEIVERRNHSFTTSYVPAGRDATVVYGTTDFRFKNSRSYPIKLEASVADGIASFKIHSVAPEETEYEVKILPVITQSIPYATEQVQDPTLMPGEQKVVQSGHAGYRVTTYKQLSQNGNIISKDIISNDVYQPMRTIIKVGP